MYVGSSDNNFPEDSLHFISAKHLLARRWIGDHHLCVFSLQQDNADLILFPRYCKECWWVGLRTVLCQALVGP